MAPTSLGFEPIFANTVMVVVDASQKLTLAALKFALQKIVNPGDRLYLLGVLHKISNPMKYKQKADATGTKSGGINVIKLENVRVRKQDELESAIADQEVQKLIALKQVSPKVILGTGPIRKEVTKEWAEQLSATWVILDKKLKKDKAYLRDNLNCNSLMMKPKGEAYAAMFIEMKGTCMANTILIIWMQCFWNSQAKRRALPGKRCLPTFSRPSAAGMSAFWSKMWSNLTWVSQTVYRSYGLFLIQFAA